ncbi:unnamed protein product, partial [Prunus brigantina]
DPLIIPYTCEELLHFFLLYTIFDWSVTITYLELQNGSLIVQKWRFGSWLDGLINGM